MGGMKRAPKSSRVLSLQWLREADVCGAALRGDFNAVSVYLSAAVLNKD